MTSKERMAVTEETAIRRGGLQALARRSALLLDEGDDPNTTPHRGRVKFCAHKCVIAFPVSPELATITRCAKCAAATAIRLYPHPFASTRQETF